MITTPEFVAAEIAYRTQRLTEDFRAVRRTRKRRALLHLPRFAGLTRSTGVTGVTGATGAAGAERVAARSLASG